MRFLKALWLTIFFFFSLMFFIQNTAGPGDCTNNMPWSRGSSRRYIRPRSRSCSVCAIST